MSADNGIYILKTLNQSTKDGFEYRVDHLQAIENVYFNWYENEETKNQDIWIENARKMWENCEVFLDKDLALKEASRMYDEIMNDDICPICEYGISYIKIERIF